MKLTPHVSFDGKAEAAANFYATIFNGKIADQGRYGECMSDVAEEHKQRIIYSRVEFGQNILAICDVMPGDTNDFGNGGYSLDLDFQSVEEIENIYAKLSDGGTVVCPLEKTFFSERFAVVTDKFGITWNLVIE